MNNFFNTEKVHYLNTCFNKNFAKTNNNCYWYITLWVLLCLNWFVININHIFFVGYIGVPVTSVCPYNFIILMLPSYLFHFHLSQFCAPVGCSKGWSKFFSHSGLPTIHFHILMALNTKSSSKSYLNCMRWSSQYNEIKRTAFRHQSVN